VKISRGWFAALLLCLIVPPVFGETEKITLYADAAGTDCSVTETVPGLVSVYMFHLGSGDRAMSRFMAPKPTCWTSAVWAGDLVSPDMWYTGNTQTGLTVFYQAPGVACYQAPMSLPTYIGTISYFVVSIGPSCCEYAVLPIPAAASVQAADCNSPFGTLLAIGAGKVTINETEDCPCNPPLAIEETTWGRVKSLYR